MIKYDHYAEAEILAKELQEAGHLDSAYALRDAMMEGETGTEIFMILRANLRTILQKENLLKETFERAMTLYKNLDEALK